MKFEEIQTDLADTFRRAKVFGGWIVTVTSDVVHMTDSTGMNNGWDWRTSMAFVFDPFHLWKIK